MSLSDVPAQYRAVGPYVKIANDFKDHDQVLYYWSELKIRQISQFLNFSVLNYAVEKALTLGDSNVPELRQYLIRLLDVLEKVR